VTRPPAHAVAEPRAGGADSVDGARPRGCSDGVTRVALVDDHPAVLAGLQRVIEYAPDLRLVASVGSQNDLRRALDRQRADVVVVDYDLAGGDGLVVCQRLKRRPSPPRVVIYSAYAGEALLVAAHLAGADALIDKSEPVSRLLSAIRRAADGDAVLPGIPIEAQHAAMRRLEEEDRGVAAMLLSGASHQGIAEALAVERREVVWRTARLIARVRPSPRSDARDPQPTSA
jgi:DNA-binding NarL/FixJ family response regulator